MKRKWKIWVGILVVLVVAGGVVASVKFSQKGIVTVQTGRVTRGDLASVVTASGEIKPRNYINIGATAFGRITAILVKEGDRVKKGQMLARVESVQPEADVAAQKASVSSSEAESSAAEAAVKSADENLATSAATLNRAKADLELAQLNYDRYSQMYKQALIAKADFDARRIDLDTKKAAVREAEARLEAARAQRGQAAAQLTSMQRRIIQSQAQLRRFADALDKTTSVAPLDGVVTNLPVRVGESVVPGIQNSQGSLIMTIADMSVITAEVKVDETDIVNVQLGQAADITVDAIPNKTFKGHVIEIGNTAILRSTGLAASQSAISSQEAKDFKVVVAMDNPPDEIRPGLSCTAKVTTATREKALMIPIQALTVRQKGDLEPKPKAGTKPVQASNKPADPAAEKAKREEVQGVFVISGEKAEFHKVETGITGATEIEVVNGLKDGDQIVTGTYQVIRTLANEAKVKVDNTTKAPAGKTT